MCFFNFMPKMELEDLIKKCSEKIDKKIIKEKEKNSKYLGGTVKIEYDGDLYVEVLFTLYFQDQKKNCFQTDGRIEYKAEYLSEQAIKKLTKEKSLEYEFKEPEETQKIDKDIEKNILKKNSKKRRSEINNGSKRRSNKTKS